MHIINETARQYAEEAKQRWGNTDAYKESAQKAASRTPEEQNNVIDGLNALFAEFAAIKGREAPESEATQMLVKKLQTYITENFYNCTPEILKGLGQMYVADKRFKTNINKNGAGTAEFISKAIEVHCG